MIAPLATSFLVCSVLLMQPSTYTAHASFLPQDRSNNSNLAGLALQLGMALPTAEPGQSPQFYADLLTSREILKASVETSYTTRSGRTSTLVDFYDRGGDEPLRRTEAAIDALRDNVIARVNQRTGLVTLEVTTEERLLSRDIADRLLSLLNGFNLDRRVTQAAAERRFAEQRLKEAREELRQAEDRQEEFVRRNRQFELDPQLSLQNARLMREVALRQSVVMTLAQGFEQARLDEVRDTPVITIVEEPDVAARPDRRGLLQAGILAGLFGGLLALAVAFLTEVFRQASRSRTGDYEEFVTLRREAVQGLRRLVPPLSRNTSPSEK